MRTDPNCKKIVRFPREKLHKSDKKPTNIKELVLIQSLCQNKFLFSENKKELTIILAKYLLYFIDHKKILIIFNKLHHWNLRNSFVYSGMRNGTA